MSRLVKTLFIIAVLTTAAQAERVGVFYDKSIPQFEFAASDVKVALENQGFDVEMKPIAELVAGYEMKKVVMALKSDSSVMNLLVKQGGAPIELAKLGKQAYALRTTQLKQQSYWVLGGDVAGGMYGGLEIAENIAFNSLDGTYNDVQEPYLKKRGIKFNIPLDQRVPSLDSDGDQDKSNIKDMWDMDFWKEYFDTLARHRFNVMSYWNRHQFPAMINLTIILISP